MIKYSAHPDVIRKYESIQHNAKRPCNDVFQYAVEICGSNQAYFACGDFWKHYTTMEFFSADKRKEVPVNGVLISVDYFQETIV